MNGIRAGSNWLKTKLNGKELLCLCLIAGLCIGLLAHGFMFTNKIYNHDDLEYYADLGNAGLHSGRYFLHFFWKIFSDLSTPWLNGILGVLFICGSAFFICDAFGLRQRWQALIVTAVTQVYPANVSIYCYMYEAHIFMLGLMLASMVPWFVMRQKKWLGFILAAFAAMMTTGIYQVFIMYSVGLLILLVISENRKMLADGETAAGRLWGLAVRCAFAALAGVVLYIAGLKLIQIIGHIQLNDYQGINETGKLTLSLIPRKILEAYKTVWEFYIEDAPDYVNGRMHIFRSLLAVLAVISCFGVIICCLLRKAFLQALLVTVCVLLMPLACYGICFMGDQIVIHMITLYPMVLVLLTPVILISAEGEKGCSLRKLAAAAMLCLYLGYGFFGVVLCNQAYYRHYMAFSRAEHLAGRIAMRIEQLPEYGPGKMVDIVGGLDGTGSLLYHEDYIVSRFLPFVGVRMAADYTWDYTLPNMLSSVIGLPVEHVGDTWHYTEEETKRIQDMPCYPQEGSIAYVNDVCIIKFSDEKY